MPVVSNQCSVPLHIACVGISAGDPIGRSTCRVPRLTSRYIKELGIEEELDVCAIDIAGKKEHESEGFLQARGVRPT